MWCSCCKAVKNQAVAVNSKAKLCTSQVGSAILASSILLTQK